MSLAFASRTGLLYNGRRPAPAGPAGGGWTKNALAKAPGGSPRAERIREILLDQGSGDMDPRCEALLFAADQPLSVERLREALGDDFPETALKQVRAACHSLRLEYDELDRAFELVEVAGGFQFRTRPEYGAAVGRLRKTGPPKLSRAALETLSIIAYRQPVMRAEVERIRGVDSGGVLKALLERGLIKISGRENVPGRPLTYATTQRFLEVFELKGLEQLPSLEELNLGDLDLGEAGLLADRAARDLEDSVGLKPDHDPAPPMPEEPVPPLAAPAQTEPPTPEGQVPAEDLAPETPEDHR